MSRTKKPAKEEATDQHPIIQAAMTLTASGSIKVPLMVELNAHEVIEVAKLANLMKSSFEEAFNEALCTSEPWGSFYELTQKAIELAAENGGAK